MRLAFPSLAFLVLVGNSGGAPEVIEPAPQAAVTILPISDQGFAGSSINVVAGLQNTLFTNGENQYAAFYGAEGQLLLAERHVDQAHWRVVDTKLTGRVQNAHNTVAMAVDGEGYLHVAWDHHGNPLNYVRSRVPGSLELGEREPMTGEREDRVTYPQFLRLPSGDLVFFYRDGQSGRGNLVLNRYSTASRRWTQVHPNLIDGGGRRSAYPALMVDAEGRLHLAWNWRESPDVATNHDLAYARSEDEGRSWTAVDGKPLRVPMTYEGAAYALRLPQRSGLMNPPALTVDSAGRPCLASYWRPEGSDVPQYHVVRYNGSSWQVHQVTRRTTPFELAGASTKRPPISRSALIPAAAGATPGLHLIYRDDERGGRILAVSCPDLDVPRWEVKELTRNSVGAWEPSFDPVQAQRSAQFHALVQRVEQRDGDDRQAAAVPPTPVGVLIWNPMPPSDLGSVP
jgi:hypothetical protein